MYQIDNSTAALVQPAPTAFGTAGYFTDGNPAVGQAATVLPAEFMNSLMLEGLNVLSAAGIAPAKGSYNQLALAIKTIIQGGATTYAVDTGAVNAYVLALTPAITAYTSSTKVRGLVSHTNTGASTLDAGGGAKPLVGLAHAALQGGEMVAGGYFEAQYSVALGKFILLWCTGAAEQVANATQSQHALTLAQAQGGAYSYAVDTGATNAIVVNLSPAPVALTDGMLVRVLMASGNNGATTIAVNGFGPFGVRGLAGTALQGGELALGGRATFMWAASQSVWVLLSSQTAALQVGPAVYSQHALQLGQAQAMFSGLGAVPGQIEWFATLAPPAAYLAANGAAISRVTYAALFAAITAQVVGTVTSGSNSITGVTSPNAMWVGMPISGPGIPAGATITAVGGSTLTLSANATATTAGATVAICPHGVGDGSTTFNVPDGRGKSFRGWDNGAGLDPGRVFGSYQADGNASHTHGVNDPGHAHQHNFVGGTGFTAGGVFAPVNGSSSTAANFTGISIQNSGGTEARMKNLALLPCIKY
jgi:hypothetical protein